MIPAGVASIGEYAFSSCSNLAAVVIPSSVTNIGNRAFLYCPRLTSVTIPESVTSMGTSAFFQCNSLTSIYFRGNAPIIGSSVFGGDNISTVYYLPGFTTWGPIFGGRPTALWQPQVQTGDVSFGVRTNQFGFNIDWAKGMKVVIEASSNPTAPTWLPLQTNTLTADSLFFTDPDWTSHPARFYRVRWP